MKITKKDTNTKYRRVVLEHTIDFAGKELIIEDLQHYDNYSNDYDSDIRIVNEEDFTSGELEFINDYMTEILDGDITEISEDDIEAYGLTNQKN